jgi:hypothetical protein
VKRFRRRALLTTGPHGSFGSDREPEPTRAFVVECYWPGVLEQDARNALDRINGLVGEGSSGQSVRSLGCVLMPSDGMALFLFAASNEDSVRGVGRLIEFPFDRIVESVFVGLGQPRPDR